MALQQEAHFRVAKVGDLEPLLWAAVQQQVLQLQIPVDHTLWQAGTACRHDGLCLVHFPAALTSACTATGPTACSAAVKRSSPRDSTSGCLTDKVLNVPCCLLACSLI